MTNSVREQRISSKSAPLLALLVTLASGVFAATEVNLRGRRLMCAEKSFSRWMR